MPAPIARRSATAPVLLAALLAWPCLAGARPGEAEPEEGSYVQFAAAKGSELVFAAFRTAFLDPTDEEDEYPIVMEVLRKGIPLWSRVATLEHDWTFLSTEMKVTWAADGKSCLASYRSGPGSVTIFGVDLAGPLAKQTLFSVGDAVEAALKSKGDDGPQGLARESVETMEMLKDETAKITIAAARARPHKVAVIVDRHSGEVQKWTVE